MARFIFTQIYNHRWPSRAMTEFRPKAEAQTVRREVAQRAFELGRGHYPEDDHDTGDAAGPDGFVARGDSGPGDTADGIAVDGDVHDGGADDGAGAAASDQ